MPLVTICTTVMQSGLRFYTFGSDKPQIHKTDNAYNIRSKNGKRIIKAPTSEIEQVKRETEQYQLH